MFSDLPIASTVSMASKYKKVKYHTSDNGQWMFFWVQTWAWLSGAHWVSPVGWKRVSTLPGAADRLEAVQTWFLFQCCVSSSTTGLWGVLTAELRQTVSQAEADITWVALLSSHRGSQSNSAWQRNGRSQGESQSSWLRSCLQPSLSSSHRGT